MAGKFISFRLPTQFPHSLKDYFSIKYRAFEKVPSDLSKHTVTVCFYVIVKSFHIVGLISKKYC